MGYTQIDQEKEPLIDILISIQEKHNYQFTYADDAIKDVYINIPSQDFTLKECINYLRKETHLLFKFLENNFIAITTKDSSYFICGYIIDKETNSTIEGVIISGNTNNYTFSDSFGYFSLKMNQENESVLLKHLAFRPVVKEALFFVQNFCSNIFLFPQTQTLSEILVTNYIAKGIDNVSDGTYDINFSNFGVFPGLIETDVLQTIQALPGIQSINETVSDINIRGGTHDQNLILWDGIKMYQSGHFFGMISVFNPLTTTSATVIKNGTNVDLTDGVSGSISVKTDSKINNKLKGSIGGNLINVDGYIDAPLGEKSSLQVSARKAISDLKTPTYNNYFDRILQDTKVKKNISEVVNSDVKFDFHDTSLRWLYNVTIKDFLRVNFLNINNELIFNENAFINSSTASKKSSVTQNSIAGIVHYKRNWNPNFATTLQVYKTDYQLKAISSNLSEGQRLRQENVVSETAVKLNSWNKYNDNLFFLNGYQITESGINNLTIGNNPLLKGIEKEIIREHALYSQINFSSSSKKTDIKAGIRYNYIEQFNKYLGEPRFSINQKFLNKFSIEVLGEFKHQNTSQIIDSQNDFLGIEKRRWFLSNTEDIPIITSKQVSLGLNYSDRGWLVNAEGYLKEIDGITSQSQGFLNQYKFVKSIGSYQVNGIDLLVNKRLKNINTWLSYTYAINEYTFSEFSEINFLNNFDIRHVLKFGTSFSTGNFKVSSGLNWHTGKPTTKPILSNQIIDNTINYREANSSNLIDYLRIDASASYKFNITRKIEAKTGFSIWNAFDQKNIIGNYYKIDSPNTTKEITNKALNSTPNFSFRVVF